MSKVEIPEGYKELSFNQPHVETLGPGYYKREDNNLYMAFYVKPENCNGYGTAHGGC